MPAVCLVPLRRQISRSEGLDVYAYSVFYVFFDQYLYIVSVATLNTILAFSTRQSRVFVCVEPCACMLAALH